jgi:hypothetical protein
VGKMGCSDAYTRNVKDFEELDVQLTNPWHS